jgi:hypothetical protein
MPQPLPSEHACARPVLPASRPPNKQGTCTTWPCIPRLRLVESSAETRSLRLLLRTQERHHLHGGPTPASGALQCPLDNKCPTKRAARFCNSPKPQRMHTHPPGSSYARLLQPGQQHAPGAIYCAPCITSRLPRLSGQLPYPYIVQCIDLSSWQLRTWEGIAQETIAHPKACGVGRRGARGQLAAS